MSGTNNHPETPYLRILEKIDDFAMFINSEMKYLALSESLVKAFNLDASKILNKPISESIGDPFSPNGDLHYINKALVNNKATIFRSWVMLRKDIHRYMEIQYSPSTNKDGDVDGVVIIAKDYSKLKKNQDRILQSEEQFRRAILLAPYPAMIHKEDGGILIVNDTWLDITGYSRQEIRNLDTWLTKAFGAWKQKVEQQYVDFWKLNKEFNDGEFIVRSSSGNYRIWTFRSAHLGTNEFGERIAITAALDLTETKEYEDRLKDLNETLEERVLQRERDLKQSEEEFRSAFETASHGIAIVSNDGLWIRVNEAMTKILGYSKEEFDDIRIKHVVDNETYILERKKLNQLIKGDADSYHLEKQLIRKDKTKIWVLSSVSIVRDEHNSPIHFITQIIDINDRKLFEKNLIIAKQQAEEANKHKSEFLANVSHEIRTPLNSIIGFSELLHEKLVAPKEREYLKTITTSGTTLLNLINDILDLSAVEAGQLEIKPTKTSIIDLISEVIRVFDYESDKKEIDIIPIIDQQLPSTLEIDEKRLRQILLNLVGNAVKFTETGSVTIKTETKIIDQQKCQLAIHVIDTGIGIAQESINAIFDAFRQQSGQDSRKYGGTGLGLTITKKLVTAMNGEITVSSEQGRGSTFQIVFYNLPYSHTQTEDKKNSIQAKSVTEKQNSDSPPILVIEDDPTNKNLLLKILERNGHKTETAETLKDGLVQIEDLQPYIIIIDLHLPDGEGEFLLKKIIEKSAISNAFVIATSGLNMPFVHKYIKEGMISGFLLKPYKTKELVNLVSELEYKKSNMGKDSKSDLFLATQRISDDFILNIKHATESGILSEYEKILDELEVIQESCEDLALTQFVNIARYRFDQFEFEQLNTHLLQIDKLRNKLIKQLNSDGE